MAKRSFDYGINEVNGYKVNIIRVVSAYNNADNSRIAAKYFGDITHPNGDITFMGDDGMTVTQIKKIIGGSSRTYNRGNRVDNELNQLEKLRKQLESLGISTADIESKIEAKKAEIERERISAELMRNRLQRIKELKQDLVKYVELHNAMVNLGLDTTEVDAKVDAIYAEIRLLED